MHVSYFINWETSSMLRLATAMSAVQATNCILLKGLLVPMMEDDLYVTEGFPKPRKMLVLKYPPWTTDVR